MRHWKTAGLSVSPPVGRFAGLKMGERAAKGITIVKATFVSPNDLHCRTTLASMAIEYGLSHMEKDMSFTSNVTPISLNRVERATTLLNNVKV